MTITSAVRTALSIIMGVVFALIFTLGALLVFTDLISAPTTRHAAALVVMFLSGIAFALLVIARMIEATNRQHTHNPPSA